MTQPFTLLHLSDLHFGQDRGAANVYFDQKLVTAAILEDAADLRKGGMQPNRVLITGDIAFSGKAKEYDAARLWLQQLAQTLGIGLDRFFLVPGNHDVDRGSAYGSKAADKKLLASLRREPAGLSDFLTDEERDDFQRLFWPKLQSYADFSAAFGASLITPERPFALEKLEWAGKPLFLLGLNTCLLSFDGSDAPTNLALGLGQLQRAFEQIPLDALTLVLLHHPPDWLADGGAKHPSVDIKIEHCLNTFLQKRPHLLLSGHVHEPGGLVAHPMHSGGLLHFVAGAAHAGVGETVPHAYAWLRLRAEGIDYFPRAWNPKQQKFLAQGFEFTLEKGESYARIKREKLPDGLQGVLPPVPQPAYRDEQSRTLGEEYWSCLERLRSLETSGADETTLRQARNTANQLKRKWIRGPRPEPGQVLSSRYQIHREIGQGGFATVYLAMDRHTERLVALKVVTSDVLNNPKELERFERGVREMKALTHPHIVKVLSEVEEDRLELSATPVPHVWRYVVLEYAPGGDFEKRVKARLPSANEVLTVVLQMADALEHVHAGRCFHRDVKPSNILLMEDGTAKLTDFDLAKIRQSTMATGFAGTVMFAAPEQKELLFTEKGEAWELDGRADEYALALTLIYGLTGKVVSDMRRLSDILQQLPVPSPTVKKVLEKALEHRPEERYPSMRDFREALVQAWRYPALVPPVLPPSSPPKSPPPVNTKPLAGVWPLWGMVFLAVLGLATWGIKILWPNSSSPTSPTTLTVSSATPTPLLISPTPAPVAVPMLPTPAPVVATPTPQTAPPIPPFMAFSLKLVPRGWQSVTKWSNPSPVLYWKASLDKTALVGGDSVKPWLAGTEKQGVFRVDTSKSFLQCWSPAVNLESLPSNQAVGVLCQLKSFQDFGLSGFAVCEAVWGKEGCRPTDTATVQKPPITWITIPGGTFTMGSDDWEHTKPPHSVTVPTFQISQREITVAEYRACFEANPKGCTKPDTKGTNEHCNWGYLDRDNHPINCVDWKQARAFASWMGARIPTEAQWEYAARGEEGRKYPWGNAPEPSCDRAVMAGCGSSTAPVCSKTSGNTPTTALCDMAGNVYEWVEDCYTKDYTGAPEDGSARTSGCSESSSRVVRGGGCCNGGVWLRAAYRGTDGLGDRGYGVGFRVVRSAPRAGSP